MCCTFTLSTFPPQYSAQGKVKKCCFWVLAVIQGFRANVLGELRCMCVAAHQNTLSLLRYALLSDGHWRAVSCCFIAVGQSYRVPLQASQSSLFMKLIKVAGSGPSFRTAWVTSDGKDSSVLEKVLLLVQSVIYFLSSL